MSTILHLSDLHFGEEISEGRDAGLLTDDKGAKKLANAIHRHIIDDKNHDIGSPNCVVVTGDLTCSAETAEFDLSEFFLYELLNLFELEKDKLVIVPGNHDISWRTEKLSEKSKYATFKSFYQKYFNIKNWSPDEPSKLIAKLPDTDEGLIIFGFNSCDRPALKKSISFKIIFYANS